MILVTHYVNMVNSVQCYVTSDYYSATCPIKYNMMSCV